MHPQQHILTFICVNVLKNIGIFSHWLCKYYTKISANLHNGNSCTATHNWSMKQEVKNFLRNISNCRGIVERNSSKLCIRVICEVMHSSHSEVMHSRLCIRVIAKLCIRYGNELVNNFRNTSIGTTVNTSHMFTKVKSCQY